MKQLGPRKETRTKYLHRGRGTTAENKETEVFYTRRGTWGTRGSEDNTELLLAQPCSIIFSLFVPRSSSWSVGHKQMSSLANQKLSIWPRLAAGQREEGPSWVGRWAAAAAAAMWRDHNINKQISGEDKREVGHKNRWNLDHAKGIVLTTAHAQTHTHTLREETSQFGFGFKVTVATSCSPAPPLLLETKTPRRWFVAREFICQRQPWTWLPLVNDCRVSTHIESKLCRLKIVRNDANICRSRGTLCVCSETSVLSRWLYALEISWSDFPSIHCMCPLEDRPCANNDSIVVYTATPQGTAAVSRIKQMINSRLGAAASVLRWAPTSKQPRQNQTFIHYVSGSNTPPR